MLKYLSFAGLMALTAACAQITPPIGSVPAQPSKCVAEAAADLIGSHGLDNAQIMQRTGASEVRRLHPNSPANHGLPRHPHHRGQRSFVEKNHPRQLRLSPTHKQAATSGL